MTTSESAGKALHQLERGLYFVDVHYQGIPHMIATGVLETSEGILLIDPGPSVSLSGLKRGLAVVDWSLRDVVGVLLTHIHLDHAGATGTIVQEQPHVKVWVHRRGAEHVVDPTRLLRSARRLYGEEMDALWGPVAPVPAGQVEAVEDGARLTVGGRRLEVYYTPGHAFHHVSYLDSETGTAFIGDVGGQRTNGLSYILPVTPPPDVDLEAWRKSLGRLRTLTPDRLFLTHFGPFPDAEEHLTQMERSLVQWGKEVRRSLSDEQTDEERAERFARVKMQEIRTHVPEEEALPYEKFGHPAASWHGLARYWRKR